MKSEEIKKDSDEIIAIKNLQKILKVSVDGIVGPITQSAINRVILKKGAKGELVSWCQNRLKNHKKYNIVIDGIFGSETERVVKQFQRDNNLEIDGIIGKNTLKLLI